MTIEEIKAALKERGWTITDLAETIGVTADGLGRILAGKRPLTQQLERHIGLVLGLRKDTLMMFRVSLPDAEVESWVPGWGKLSRAEKAAAAEAVVREAALLAAERGLDGLSAAEREELARVCGEVIHWPQQMQAPHYGAAAHEPFA